MTILGELRRLPAATSVLSDVALRVVGDLKPSYRDELRYTGLYHEDVANAYSLASRVCGKRAMGYNEEQLIRGLEYSADQYTSEQAVVIVSGAEYHFCPAYEDDGSVGRGYIGPPETV